MSGHASQAFRGEYGIACHGKESLGQGRAADYPNLAGKPKSRDKPGCLSLRLTSESIRFSLNIFFTSRIED